MGMLGYADDMLLLEPSVQTITWVSMKWVDS